MAKALPKKLYAKIVTDDAAGISFVTCDESLDALVEKGERVTIGTYELVEKSAAECVVSTGKPVKQGRSR